MQSIIPEATAVTVQDRGDFLLYYEPSSKYADLERWLKDTNYFENQIEWLNGKFKAPHDIGIVVTECAKFMPSDKAANAFYASRALTGTDVSVIVYCYELIEVHYEIMEYLVTPGQGDRILPSNVICQPGRICGSAEDRLINVIDYTFYHELGHAFIDIYNLPIPSGEEDAADGLSAYIILKFSTGKDGNSIIRNAAFSYLLTGSIKNLPIAAFADSHSLNIQRYFNLACFAYGSDPSANRDLIQAGLLTNDRARGCPQDYKKLVSSWDELL